MYNYTMPEM